ncbi:hypothetical protein YC2023_032609 [Brassica napus]
MKPQVVTIHKIFSNANMPLNFDEINEKEGSNDDYDGEDHRRFNLESLRLCITDDFKVNKASHAQKFLIASRLNEA